ncbi:Hypothetical predicted protein [Mytilus galloprovincialis]|uniref:Uncharacterized protein n=1 Tax=Mytilus galloprovincialis TaxID=29158 RepID=A0A8B6DYJ2_MYTGA|nr:Hypothetical predicted protein [Mytilus galloprovincialis]
MASAIEEIIDYPTTDSSAQCEVKEVQYQDEDVKQSKSCSDCIVVPLKKILSGKKRKQTTGATQKDVYAISRSVSTEIQLIPVESAHSLNEGQINTGASSFNDISTLSAANQSISSQYNTHTIGKSSKETSPRSVNYRISTDEYQLHSRRSSDGSISSTSSSYFEIDPDSLENDEISIAHGIHIHRGVQFVYSIFIFKRLIKAVTVFSIYLFGFYNELYTRKSAKIRFRNNEASVKDFKILKFSRTRKKDIVEVYKTLYPHRVRDLIKLFKDQICPPSSKPLNSLNSSLQPSSAPISNACTKQVATINCSIILPDVQQGQQTIKRHVEKQIHPSVNKIPKDKKFEKEVIPSKVVLKSHQNRLASSKIRTTSSNNRDTTQTTRIKMKNAKVKSSSNYKPPKLNIFTTRDENISNIVEDFIRDDIVRQAVYDCFNNEQKMHFQRPLVPWPSMHPLLPYKVRYLDEQSTDHHTIRTTSSPPNSSDENSEEIDEPHNTFSH